MSPSGHAFQQDVPLLLLNKKSGTENSAVSGSGLREPQPGGDFLGRKLWGLKHPRAHAPGGSEQLWAAGSWGQHLQVEGQEGQKGPRGGRKGSGLQSPQRSPERHPSSLPAWLFSRLWGKQRLYACRGKAGEMQPNRKGNFLFLQYHGWNSCHLPARCTCTRKQKSQAPRGPASLLPCAAKLRQPAGLRPLSPLSCCSGSQDKRRQPANHRWQDEDTDSDLLFESLLGEKII